MLYCAQCPVAHFPRSFFEEEVSHEPQYEAPEEQETALHSAGAEEAAGSDHAEEEAPGKIAERICAPPDGDRGCRRAAPFLPCSRFSRTIALFSASRGGMAEWSMAHAWRACNPERGSRVRIPVPPPSRAPDRSAYT